MKDTNDYETPLFLIRFRPVSLLQVVVGASVTVVWSLSECSGTTSASDAADVSVECQVRSFSPNNMSSSLPCVVQSIRVYSDGEYLVRDRLPFCEDCFYTVQMENQIPRTPTSFTLPVNSIGL